MADDFPPERVTTYRVSRQILAETASTLRARSRGAIESVALWQGQVVSRDVAEVRHLVVPHQVAGPLHFNVPLDERLRLIDVVSDAGHIILAQIHTHPEDAFHSAVDDRLAIPQHVGGISIVVARFAVDWDGDLEKTSVNRHLGSGRWEELTVAAVRQLFVVT